MLSIFILVFVRFYEVGSFSQMNEDLFGSAPNNTWNHPASSSMEERYTESLFSVTCCKDGYPIPDDNIVQHVRDWSYEMTGPMYSEGNTSCNRYNGKYSIPLKITLNNKDFTSGVKCYCPVAGSMHLDRNCRYSPECKNGGYRAFSINLRCVCPGQYFGELCEKFCLNGELVKNQQKIDQCVCKDQYFGDECDGILCYNGGTPVGGRGCSCGPGFLGAHCEVALNRTLIQNDIFDQYRRQVQDRHVTWSVSLFFTCLILFTLVFYMFRKRRMFERRFEHDLRAMNHPRRTPRGSAISGGGGGRAGNRHDVTMTSSAYGVAVETGAPPSGGGEDAALGPPPFLWHQQMEALGPLPTYEDAVKACPNLHNSSPGGATNLHIGGGGGRDSSNLHTMPHHESSPAPPYDESPSSIPIGNNSHVTHDDQPNLHRTQENRDDSSPSAVSSSNDDESPPPLPSVTGDQRMNHPSNLHISARNDDNDEPNANLHIYPNDINSKSAADQVVEPTMMGQVAPPTDQSPPSSSCSSSAAIGHVTTPNDEPIQKE